MAIRPTASAVQSESHGKLGLFAPRPRGFPATQKEGPTAEEPMLGSWSQQTAQARASLLRLPGDGSSRAGTARSPPCLYSESPRPSPSGAYRLSTYSQMQLFKGVTVSFIFLVSLYFCTNRYKSILLAYLLTTMPGRHLKPGTFTGSFTPLVSFSLMMKRSRRRAGPWSTSHSCPSLVRVTGGTKGLLQRLRPSAGQHQAARPAFPMRVSPQASGRLCTVAHVCLTCSSP